MGLPFLAPLLPALGKKILAAGAGAAASAAAAAPHLVQRAQQISLPALSRGLAKASIAGGATGRVVRSQTGDVEARVGQPRASGAMDFRRVAPWSQLPFSPIDSPAGESITRSPVAPITPTRSPVAPITPAPSQPSLSAGPVGEFVSRAPATPPAITTEARSPITTPATAPIPASLPPIPVIPGGGTGFSGGVGRVPAESMLPPTPVLPSEIFEPAGQFSGMPMGPMGQFDAMTRALQLKQGDHSRFIQTPATGVASFGPAPAQERMLRKLRDRELVGRVL